MRPISVFRVAGLQKGRFAVSALERNCRLFSSAVQGSSTDEPAINEDGAGRPSAGATPPPPSAHAPLSYRSRARGASGTGSSNSAFPPHKFPWDHRRPRAAVASGNHKADGTSRIVLPAQQGGGEMSEYAPERRDLRSYKAAFFDTVPISDSLERVVNRNFTVNLTGSEVTYKILKNRGVRTVFGYSGGAVLPLIDQFFEDAHRTSHVGEESIQFIQSANESCAGHAAQAFGKATGMPGVAIVTSGPGLTNLITPIQDAFMDGDPLIVISAQVPTTAMGTDAFQECPATALTKPCTKWNFLAQDVESIPWALEQAFRAAMSGRKGPVHIDLPKNVLIGSGDIPAQFLTPRPYRRDLGEAVASRENSKLLGRVDPQCIEKLASLINRAEKPVIIAGHGAAHASESLRELAIKTGVPVTTTMHGMGVFDELHPLSLHMLGMHGAAYANLAIQNADLIISVGSRFDDRTTGLTSLYAPAARAAAKEGRGGIVHLDIEARQIGRTVEPSLAIVADCQAVLELILFRVEAKERPAWIEQIRHWKEKHPLRWIPTTDGKLKTQQAIDAIYRGTQKPEVIGTTSLGQPRDFSVCTGVGNHQMMSCQFFRWRRPRQLISSGGLGTMGSGLPFAIGTQVANPETTVILVDGDGSFNMSLVDLCTVSRLKLPLKLAIMNDGYQQMVRAWQKLFFEDRCLATSNHNPDYVKLAESYGIKAIRCTHADELDEKVAEFLGTEGPVLCDFQVLPDLCLPMVKPGNGLDDMLLPDTEFSGRLEGMAPS